MEPVFLIDVPRLELVPSREESMGKSLGAGLLAVLLLAGAATTLGACNTTAGAGKDLTAAGQALTNAAEKNKDSDK